LPAEFDVVRPGVAVRRGYEAELAGWLAWLGDGDPAGARHAGGSGGRGGVRRARLADGGEAYVRRYLHGGLLGALLRDVYWQHPPRPWRELAATEAARRAGVPAPEVLAAAALPLAARRAGGPTFLYRGLLVTRALAGRRPLGDALRAARDAGERRAWIACAVRAVQGLHRAGVTHPDLNVSNVLVVDSPEEPAALIDFDRAVVGRRPPGRLRVALAVRRLSRSIAKLGLPGLDRRGAAAALREAGLGGAR
jgi:hypothetical protein